MDKSYLRIIANPYRLKQNKNQEYNPINNELKINELLYTYLEQKYNDIYINPNLYYNIINEIDSIIIKYTSSKILDEIIETIINKFDIEVQ